MALDKQGRPQTANSPQELQNDSFDPEFRVAVVEMLGVDPDTNTINRAKVNSGGQLSIADGFSIPSYDYIALTYVATGNGVGKIETATFKTGGSSGTTIATLTLAYNASNEIESVTKS